MRVIDDDNIAQFQNLPRKGDFLRVNMYKNKVTYMYLIQQIAYKKQFGIKKTWHISF